MLLPRPPGVIRLLATFLVYFIQIYEVVSHGMLMDPPARNSLWRHGFHSPVNYNDNELYCGGFGAQFMKNKGKCGVCGDDYSLPVPRPHEAGGQYARGIIGRRYVSGQIMDIEIELTTNHNGFFELRLCPNNDARREVTQQCLDQFPLPIADGSGYQYIIPADARKREIFQYQVKLPDYVTCTQCVLQWTYHTANSWGLCPNGTYGIGCGNQENFRNCADISIITTTGGFGPRPPFTNFISNPFLLYYRDFVNPKLVHPLVIRGTVCLPTRRYAGMPGMDDWCQANCLRYPPNCPADLCHCPSECDAVGSLARIARTGHQKEADVWCMHECLDQKKYKSCPLDRCNCY